MKRHEPAIQRKPEEDLVQVRDQTLRLVADLEESLFELQQVLQEREHRETVPPKGKLNGAAREDTPENGQR